MAILETQEDPRGLIREAYRIEGISPHECRTIFLDWALSLPEGTDTREMAARLLQADPPADHPMTAVLRDATKEPPARIRRGGRRAPAGLSATLLLPLYILLVNAAAFLAFAFDKRRARSGGWRVPEATLLKLAMAGGSVGAKLAQHRLRHKTRKQPFRRQLNLVCTAQVVLLVLAALWWGRQSPGLAGYLPF